MSDILKMKKEIEEWKAERVAKGLPASPPKEFVPPEVGYILFERCKPLFDVLVKYAKLCGDAQAVLPIDDSKFAQYESDLALIGESIGGGGMAFSTGLKGAINTIKKHGDYTPDKYVRLLLQCLQIAGLEVKKGLDEFAYDYKLESSDREYYMKKVYANYEQYKSDEALFNAELERLKEHYKSIKHLY
ncbi:hypothetical protein V7128_16945 [Neobacillus vireti]|uniref:hypothetical protein n=1 Tax=Neobacillus vireti TaxID=220686 RepID=UPI002FFF91AE